MCLYWIPCRIQKQVTNTLAKNNSIMIESVISISASLLMHAADNRRFRQDLLRESVILALSSDDLKILHVYWPLTDIADFYRNPWRFFTKPFGKFWVWFFFRSETVFHQQTRLLELAGSVAASTTWPIFQIYVLSN